MVQVLFILFVIIVVATNDNRIESYSIMPLNRRCSVSNRYISLERRFHKTSSTLQLSNNNDRFDLTTSRQSSSTSNNNANLDSKRRKMWQKSIIQGVSLLSIGTIMSVWIQKAWASTASRTDGYAVQKTEDEWKQQLSPIQYFVLRQGGTERPGYSMLESEKRSGIFKCAGCNTPLFESGSKFTSGTGWPSFARALPGVEVEQVNPITAQLSGAELRCKTCGGHLGDVFNDGYLFLGTEAFKTGQRYCIDGAALIFYPDNDGEEAVRGDIPAKKDIPSWLEPPKITPTTSK